MKRALAVTAALLGSLVLGLLFLVTVFAADGEATEGSAAPVGALKVGKGGVPAKYEKLITDAAKCSNGQNLSPAVLAAQLRQESGFNPRAGSSAGAQGIAQFIPSTWKSRGVDGDGDGDRDVWDPKDAIPAQGKMMCDLLKQASKARGYQGSPTELALAGYNAGWGAVQKYKGIPPYRETQHYVKTIMAGVKDLSAPAGDAGSSGQGGWSLPVDAKLGTPYHASGSNWSSGQHTGVDFTAPTGTPVKAVGPGKVVAAGPGGAYGTQAVVRHGDGMHSQYGHLSALQVRIGQTVKGGQRLGRSGATGNVTGPHLHFEIRTTAAYGSDIAPLPYLRKHGLKIG